MNKFTNNNTTTILLYYYHWAITTPRTTGFEWDNKSTFYCSGHVVYEYRWYWLLEMSFSHFLLFPVFSHYSCRGIDTNTEWGSRWSGLDKNIDQRWNVKYDSRRVERRSRIGTRRAVVIVWLCEEVGEARISSFYGAGEFISTVERHVGGIARYDRLHSQWDSRYVYEMSCMCDGVTCIFHEDDLVIA